MQRVRGVSRCGGPGVATITRRGFSRDSTVLSASRSDSSDPGSQHFEHVNPALARGRPAPRLPVPTAGSIRVSRDSGRGTPLVADDYRAAVGDTEQLGEVGVLPAAGLVAADPAAMPACSPPDRGAEHAMTSSRWSDRQTGTFECGSGMGPSTNTCAPVPRNCCIRWVKLSIHTGLYARTPCLRVRGGASHAQHDQPRVLARSRSMI